MATHCGGNTTGGWRRLEKSDEGLYSRAIAAAAVLLFFLYGCILLELGSLAFIGKRYHIYYVYCACAVHFSFFLALHLQPTINPFLPFPRQ